MSPFRTLPFFLRFSDTDKILLVGGGFIASAKASSLLATGAVLRVVARNLGQQLKETLATHSSQVEVLERDYCAEDLKDVRFVVVATNDSKLNSMIYHDAQKAKILTNVVDKPDLCDGYFGAVVNRGEIQIAIGSQAASPLLSRLVKRNIELALPSGLASLTAFLGRWKSHLREQITDSLVRRKFLEKILEGPIAQLVSSGDLKRADLLMEQALVNKTPQVPALYLIGAGPGDPDLITVRGTVLLAKADVVLYDRLVAPEILERYARKDAEKIEVGKSRGAGCSQSIICELIRDKLKSGLVVARLKGGDPTVFARLAEELQVAKDLNITPEIVPGVTAALGCAAYVGIPLTERNVSQGIRIITNYQDSTDEVSLWDSLKPPLKETLVFYMSAKSSVAITEKLLELGFSAEIPALVIEKGTTPEQRIYSASLGDFSEKFKDQEFGSPSLLIIGEVTRWQQIFADSSFAAKLEVVAHAA